MVLEEVELGNWRSEEAGHRISGLRGGMTLHCEGKKRRDER